MAEETSTLPQTRSGSLPLAAKLALAGVLAVTLLGLGALVGHFVFGTSKVAFTGLTAGEVRAVANWLIAHDISHQSPETGVIEIPAEHLRRVRLGLAGAGLLRSGTASAGIGADALGFDNPGGTENYWRQLEDELAETIATLAPIENASVRLMLPGSGLTPGERHRATAAVNLRLNGEEPLSDQQLETVIALVSGSVEGLDPAAVTVVDDQGLILAAGGQVPSSAVSGNDMFRRQLAIETQLEQRAQVLLDRVLGIGNALVQVTASVSSRSRERREEIFDPARTVVTDEEIVREQASPGPQGSEGDGAGSRQLGDSRPTLRSEERIRYQASRTVDRTIEPLGTLNRVSALVLVADKVFASPKTAGSAPSSGSDEQLAAIEEMVRGALGLEEERGDRLTIITRPFAQPEPLPPRRSEGLADLLGRRPLIDYLFALFCLVLVYVVVIRPLFKVIDRLRPFRTVEELERQLAALNREDASPEFGHLRNNLLAKTSSPAQVVSAWLQEE